MNIEPQLIRVNLSVLMIMFIVDVQVGFIVVFVFNVFNCFKEEGYLYLFIYSINYD